MGHSHSHSHTDVEVPKRTQRRLLVAVVPFVVATLAGLVILWPNSADVSGRFAGGDRGERFTASVVQVTPEECQGVPEGTVYFCSAVTARLVEGPDAGDDVSFDYARGEGSRGIEEGDDVVVARFETAPGESQYTFVDFKRAQPLVTLAILFGVVVVVTSRWRGVTALIGLGLSVMILVRFMMPAILAGEDPLAVAIVGAAAIMFMALYLAHGFHAATTTAVLGTLASLTLTALLATLFVRAASFTGLASEEAGFLQLSAGQVDLEGLLLGGIIVGALGVLDDVTITQASAVWELRAANPSMGFGRLYRSALRIGRDHIASTVNTLVLAYAGASLPLLLIFSLSDQTVGDILTTEIMAEEIVRTLVGSIGLVSSVPITTALAALVVAGGPEKPREPRPAREPKPPRERGERWKAPRAEREWRQDEPSV
ncbi:MAG: YibE/F family protein [Actinomycetota bacterium]|nr:YibE/F family protein [Actinomycetota bacterium]